jgi:branched-chain amino acid transport system substrate-binding protein
VAAVDGNLEDREALRNALRKADFKSLRGDFKFGNNHYPIQDFYVVEVAKREDGKYQTQILKKIFDDYQDTHASQCPMNWK